MDVEPFTTFTTDNVLYLLGRCAMGLHMSSKLDWRGLHLIKLSRVCLIGMTLEMLTESGAKRECFVAL